MLIVTGYNRNLEDMGHLSSDRVKRYCDKWGHDYRIYTNRHFDTSRHPSWSKIAFINAELSTTDLVWWLDADAFITNFDLDVMSIIDDDHDLFITKDHRTLNAGSFIIRNTNLMFQFLKNIWNWSSHKDHKWHEQAGLLAEFYSNPIYGERTKLVPQSFLNSYLYKDVFEMDYPKGDYTTESLVLHLTQLPLMYKYSWINFLKL